MRARHQFLTGVGLLAVGAVVAFGAPSTTQPNLNNMILSQCILNAPIFGGAAGSVPKCNVVHTTGDATVVIATATNIEATSATLTASRAWTLPSASAYGSGNRLVIADVFGGINGANTIVLTRAGSDTINGATTQTLSTQYAVAELVSDGVSKWALPIASGSGTVTSVDASGGVETTSGTPITGSGTVRSTMLVNAQTGTTYAIADGDRGKLVTLSNAAAVAVSIAQAGTAGNFAAGWSATLVNKGAGLVTITPATSTIDGSATYTLRRGDNIKIVSDGTNYQVAQARQCCTHLSQVYTASTTYTPPPGVYFVRTQVWGGGGGSGGTDASHGSSGGGGGEYCETMVAVVPGSGVTVTIGTGGAAGSSAGPTAGGAGTQSAFGTITANGGGGSAAAVGGTGGGTGGTGGTCTSGFQVNGSAGEQNNTTNNGSLTVAIAGAGGGAYGSPKAPASTLSTQTGVTPGGGAGGQILFSTTGSSGAPGRVLVWD